jgi:ADP-ribosylglycohydrolase
VSAADARKARPYPEPERLLGSLLGGAIGDALGAPVEGVPLETIRERHGPDGPTDYVPGRGAPGSINHSGDSDSIGAVAGNLIGARFGVDALPRRWIEGLEVRDAVRRMADECVQEFGPTPPTEAP